jgi:hypothetical protein
MTIDSTRGRRCGPFAFVPIGVSEQETNMATERGRPSTDSDRQAPLSGTVDDDDNRDDEREDENEAPARETRDTQEAQDEFCLDERDETPASKQTSMRIQSQDIEKQRQATQGGPRPNEARTPPRDRPPGQPHDPPPQSDRDDGVERVPTQDSTEEGTREPSGRRQPQPPS